MVNVNEMVYDKRNEFVVLWFQGNRQDGVWSEENDWEGLCFEEIKEIGLWSEGKEMKEEQWRL